MDIAVGSSNPAATAPLVADIFARADADVIGAGTYAGSATPSTGATGYIRGETAGVGGTTQGLHTVLWSTGERDVSIRTHVAAAPTTSGVMWIVARWVDADNYLRVTIGSGGTYEVTEVVAGSNSLRGRSTSTALVGDEIQLDYVGTSLLELRVNGRMEMGRYGNNPTELLSGRSHGFGRIGNTVDEGHRWGEYWVEPRSAFLL